MIFVIKLWILFFYSNFYSNKKVIRQFGYDIFENAIGSSAQTFDVPVGPDYRVGPGDSLIIRIWGKMDETIDVTLDRRGRIYLPKVGKEMLT